MSRRTVLHAAIAAGLFVVLFGPSAAAAPGDLDMTFSDDGIATISLEAGAEADDVAVLPNGKVVAVGTEFADVGTGSQMLVVEYNASGKLDHNFGGGDGIEELSLGACTEGRAVAVDGQGRIVVAGVRENCTTSNTVIALARFLPDGSLDHAFGGGDGWLITSLTGNGEYVSDVAVDGSKIVAAGGILPGSSTVFRFLVLRWNSDGTRDHSFNGTGHRVTKFSPGSDEAVAVGVQPDHAIVACGGTRVGGVHERFAVARYLPGGGLDAAFAGDGRATVDFGPGADFCTSLVMSAGKVVLGGIADEDQAADFAFALLTTTGHPDPEFGAGGKATLSLSIRVDEVRGLVVDGSGRIVAAGWRNELNDPRFGVVRFLDDGTPDTSFGNGGIVTTKVGKRSLANGVALGDGTIVVAGQENSPDLALAVARYFA